MDHGQFIKMMAVLERIASALENGAGGNGSAGGETVEFPAAELIPEMLKGELYWKITGGQYTKFGVRVWPEVLEAAGMTDLKIMNYDLSKYTAVAQIVDGKPKKIVQLRAVMNGNGAGKAPAETAPGVKEPERVPVNGSADGGELAPASNDYTTYWTKTVPGLGVDKARAKEILARYGNDCKKAYEHLVTLGA